MAQRADRITSRVGATAPETAPSAEAARLVAAQALGLAQGHQRRAEIGRHRPDVERVDPVEDAVGAPVSEILGHPAEARVLGGVDGAVAQHDRLGDSFLPEALGRGPHPGVVPLAEHDARLASGGPAQELGPEAHRWNRRASALATTGCTSALTSPP